MHFLQSILIKYFHCYFCCKAKNVVFCLQRGKLEASVCVVCLRPGLWIGAPPGSGPWLVLSVTD